MNNKNLSIKEKEEIYKLLIKAGITNEKVLEVRYKMLEFWDEKEKVEKFTKEEKEKLVQLKYFCKMNCDEDLKFTEKIFKLNEELLNSRNPKIQRRALKIAEKLIEKYRETATEQLRKIANNKK